MHLMNSTDREQSALMGGDMASVSQSRTVKLEDTSSNLELSKITRIGEQQSAVAKAITRAAKPLYCSEMTLCSARKIADEMLWQALDGAYQVLLEAEEDQQAFDAKCAAYGIKRTAHEQSRFYLVLRLVHAAAHRRELLKQRNKNWVRKNLEKQGRNFARDNAKLLDAIHDGLVKDEKTDPGKRVIRIAPGTIIENIRRHGSVRATIKALTSKTPTAKLGCTKREHVEKKVEEWFSAPGGIAADRKKFGCGRFLAVIEVGAGKACRARLLRHIRLRDVLPFVALTADEEAPELAPSLEAIPGGTANDDSDDSAVAEVVANEEIGGGNGDDEALTESDSVSTSDPAMRSTVAADRPGHALAVTFDGEAHTKPKLVLLDVARAMQAQRLLPG
jgi:hypothetical protein